MIPCAISDTNKKNLWETLRKRLEQYKLDGLPLEPEKYIPSLYNKLLANMDQVRALSYIQLVPGYILGITGKHPGLRDHFTDKGLSLDKLNDLHKQFTKDLDAVSSFLGKSGSIITSIQDQKQTAEKIAGEPGLNPASADTLTVDSEQPFRASPVNASSTKGWGSLKGNVPNPQTQRMEEFQRLLINQILDTNDSSKLSTPLYLTAMQSSRLPGYSPGEIIFAVTDKDGNILRFDKDNKPVSDRGALSMQPDNIAKIKSGQKTITNRAEKLQEGIYQLPDGSSIEIKLLGKAVVVTTKGMEQVTFPEEATSESFAYKELNAFAQGEGFADWNDFKKNNKFSDNFIKGKQSRYVYSVKLTDKPEGEHMFYPAREVIKSGDIYSSKEELAPISAIVRKYREAGTIISTAQAEKIRQQQLRQAYLIQEHIKKDPKNQVTTIITGGSLGYVEFGQSIKTPLSSVNFTDSPLVIELEGDISKYSPITWPGAGYFKVKGLQDPIALQRNDMPPEFVDKIASMLVDQVTKTFAGKTRQIDDSERLPLIKQYLNNTDTFMITLVDGKLKLNLNGGPIDLTDTETARKQIKDYFNTFQPLPGFDQAKLTDLQRQGAIPETDPNLQSKLRQGSVVKTGEGYSKYIKPIFNINSDYLKSPEHFDDYSLEKNPDGFFELKSNPINYYEWLRKNTSINYELNAQGKIQSLNSYFTYKLSDDAKKTLYPASEQPATGSVLSDNGITNSGSVLDLPHSKAVQSFIDSVKKRGLKKSISTKTEDVKATQEQIDSFVPWWRKSPLSKHLTFEAMFNIINSDHVAEFFNSGIRLFKGSDFSDGYHEAWHGFSQGFLTKDEKTSLYKETRNLTGEFTDHTGKKLKFKDMNYLQGEEFLAEEFRKFMLTDGKGFKGGPIKLSLFRRIYYFLKSLFGSTTYGQMMANAHAINTINELFTKLRVGNINEYSFSASNAMFNVLATGIKATDPNATLQELSSDESIIAVSTIDSIFSSFVDNYNAQNSDDRITNHVFSSDEGRTLAYENVLQELKDKKREIYWKNTTETNPVTESINEKNLETLNFMIDNFGNPKDPRGKDSKEKGLIYYHNLKSKFLSFTDKFIQEETNVPESYNFKGGNETSVYEKGRPEVWYLIRGLHKMNKDGSIELNRLGFPELVDFSTTKNRLISTLQDAQDPQQMKQRLVTARAQHLFINQLLNKLGDVDSIEPFTLDVWNSFFQTFDRYRIPQQTAILDQTGDSFNMKVGEASGEHRMIQRDWDNHFSAGISGSPFIVKVGTARPFLDIPKLLLAYPKVDKANILQFLNDIGVGIDKDNQYIKDEISADDRYNDIGKYLLRRIKDLQKNFKGPVTSLKNIFKDDLLNDFGELKNEASRYDQFAKLSLKYSDQYSNFSVLTPTGDIRYEHSLNSSMTTVAKHLNNAQTYSQMLDSPLGYLDKSRNPFARVSKQLAAMFDKTGKRTGVKYIVDNVSGLSRTLNNESTGIGVSSSSADEATKLIQDIHMMFMKGVVENPRHGEKSTSYSTRSASYDTPYSHDKRIWMGPEQFVNQGVYEKMYLSILPYLFAEHERVLKMNNLKPGDAELNYPQYANNGKKFVIFDGILSDSTKEALMSLTKPLEQSMTPKLERMISEDFNQYWDKQFDQMTSQFSKAEFIAKNLLNDISKSEKNYVNPLEKFKSKPEELRNILLKAYVFNSWIHNMESSILNYGDPAQYKTSVDFHKRIAMFSSTGDIFRSDSTMIRYINQVMGMGYAKANKLKEKTFTSILQTAVMQDIKLVSDYINEITGALKSNIKQSWDKAGRTYTQAQLDAEADLQADAYRDMTVGDAQGWITFDSYRALSKAIDKWSDKQEDLYQRIISGETIDPAQALNYFPVRKYQYAGPVNTKLGLPVMAGHKFSLMPLVPTVIKDSPNLVSLHHKMIDQRIDYATLQSGSKITSVTNQGTIDKMYSDWDSRTIDNTPFTPNPVFMDFLKDQQDINSEYKGNAIFSTQLRKVIEEGLVEGGVPTDFQQDKDLSSRRTAWDKLTETQRMKYPKYVLYKTYEDSVSRLTAKKKQALIDEIGWSKPENYGKVNEHLLKLIEKELRRQDISDHEIDYINLKALHSSALKYDDLSIHFSAEKIEKMLASLINRKLVRQKISGESLVQVSGLGWTNATKEQTTEYGNTDLPFYKQANGKTSAMKVKVALQGEFLKLLKLQHNDGELIGDITRLNESVKDENWLNKADNRRMITLIGTRIPVQGLNSMEFMEVFEFLPKEAGNIIIPPFEIVSKSGSDFDIDKMTVTIPNIQKHKDGRVTLFKNYSEKEARQLYNEINNEIKSLDQAGSYEEYLKLKEQANRKLHYEQTVQRYLDPPDKEEEYSEILQENGLVRSFEDYFKELNTSTRQEENEVMWNMKSILEHPDNYASLVRPNATFTLGPIADENFRKQVSDYDPKQGTSSISGTRLMEARYNLYIHQINKVAKEALAIAAVDNTFNILFNRVGALMNYSYRDKSGKATDREAIEKRITLFMEHNTMKDYKGRDVISLSHIMDAQGKNRISDNDSQIINLLLEIAKNDSAYYLQLNKETIPTLLFLNQAGVPIDTLEYLVNQPIIKEYMQQIRLARSPVAKAIGIDLVNKNFFQNEARSSMIRKYFNDEFKYPFLTEGGEMVYNPRMMKAIKEIYELMNRLHQDPANSKAFDTARLKQNLTSTELTDQDKLVLLHWFEIEDIAKSIRDIKMNINPDTKRNMSAFGTMSKQEKIRLMDPKEILPDSIVEGLLTESPISSFGTIGQFMIDFLKPLFPLRADEKIGRFLLGKINSLPAMEEVEKTFGSLDRFTVRFFNDLVSSIFQNRLRDFDITSIKGYRNMTAEKSIDVKQTPYLKFGAFVKNNVLYYDLKQVVNDFSQKNYLGKGYKDRGLAPVENSDTFKTAKEFYNFVFEREYIRSYTKLSDITADPNFDKLDQVNLKLLKRTEGESDEGFQRRVDQKSYEEFIRDRALENIGNGWQLFKSSNSYALQVMDAISMNDLAEKYPLLNTLTMNQSRGKSPMENLQLLDTDLTGDKIDAFHYVLKQLQDPAVEKVPNTEANTRLSVLFSKMPMVAFLQSGLNTAGSFSLIRLVPAEKFMEFMQGAIKDFSKNITVPELENFYTKFIELNVRNSARDRYKDYTLDKTPLGFSPVSRNSLPIFSLSPDYFTYDPTTNTEKEAFTTVELNPNKVFVYDKSTQKTAGTPTGSNSHFGSTKITSNRTVGLPTLTSYADIPNRSLSDSTLEENKKAIDQGIQNLKDLRDAGYDIAFSKNGYGQGLIGFKQDGFNKHSDNKPGLKTFLYLSEKLFNEFNFVNKNYDAQVAPVEETPVETPQEVLAKRIPVTDDEVRKQILSCLTQ